MASSSMSIKTDGEVATAVDGTLDLFGHSGQAEMYRNFRPIYTPAIVENVLANVRERDIYIDVACGSGQLTHLLAPHFKKATGIDRSFEQLSNATVDGESKGSNLTFTPGSAFALPLEANSVDLVTVAQGLHWLLPYEAFFGEVDRVLKPGGTFTAVGYAFPQLVNRRCNESSMHFYVDILGARKKPGDEGCFWDTNRPTIDCYYSDIPFPSTTKTSMLPNTVKISVSHYINYLKTLSAYRTLLRLGHADPLPKVQSDIVAELGGSDPASTLLEVEVPFFTVHYSKPRRE
jgi:ubiquinone/menaquinone biosynthesis C-methylase UbiE